MACTYLEDELNFNGIVCFGIWPGVTLGAFVALIKLTGGVFGTERDKLLEKKLR